MDTPKTDSDAMKCDACQREISGAEVRYMSMKLCCKVERIPLCRECWTKYAQKN
jgi:hypothetical protein